MPTRLWTDQFLVQFLAQVRETKSISEACRRLGIDRSAVQRRKARDAGFRAAIDGAMTTDPDLVRVELERILSDPGVPPEVRVRAATSLRVKDRFKRRDAQAQAVQQQRAPQPPAATPAISPEMRHHLAETTAISYATVLIGGEHMRESLGDLKAFEDEWRAFGDLSLDRRVRTVEIMRRQEPSPARDRAIARAEALLSAS